jgi:predicted RND superfamily exporter protein
MTRSWRRLAVLQTRYPTRFVVGFALLTALGLWRASRLQLVTDFADLLSQQQPSVVELYHILGRTRGLSTVHIVAEGKDVAALRRFADRLVVSLGRVGAPYVESARAGLHEASRFLMPRASLFLSETDLTTLEHRLAAEERAAFRRAIGADLDDEEGAAAAPGDREAASRAPPGGDRHGIEQALIDKVSALERYPDGYFQATTPTGMALVIEVKAAVAAGDIARTQTTLDRIQAVVRETRQQFPGEGSITVGYAGDLLTSMAEYDLVRRDVLGVGGVGALLVLAVIWLFFRTPRALLALGASVGAGCVMTFGLTEMALGHLNVATAFLFSVVMGNGVNFGIIWLARFLDERRAGQTLERAVAFALEKTCGATLTAACAAATAYAALGVGRFRGFRHFAFIGACGMLLCWVTSYALLPAVVVLLERRRFIVRGSPDGRAFAHRAAYHRLTHFERPFVWVIARVPGVMLAVSLSLGIVALGLGARYLARGPLEYDLRHLQSDRDTTSELYRVSDLASRVLGTGPIGGMVVLTDRVEDTPVLAEILRHVRDAAPAAERPFETVHTLDDLIPTGQAARLERVRALTRRLTRAHERGAIDDAAWAKLRPLLPPPDVVPFGVRDLPEELVQPFTERDGTRGRILYIEQTRGQSDSNLHYLLRLADAFRSTRLPDGRVVHGSGRAVIFADLLRASLIDMPRSVVLSLVLTALTVVALFRRRRPVAMVLASLLLALSWMVGALAAFDVRLSFINFIALPITFGIGVDYPVNLYGRFQQEPGAGILAAMRGTGGAVILCSLTTSLGYLALLRSHNQAVRSLGAVAVLGEVTCLTAALLALPAAVVWLERRRRGRAESAPTAVESASPPA